MEAVLRPLSEKVELTYSEFWEHQQRDYAYLMELKTENLLRPFLFEAGLFCSVQKQTEIHWGWDGPMSYLRGQFTGHWLSAAARLIHQTGDQALKQKADGIVQQIALCQKENGGEWAFPIPEKYLLWLKRGKQVWAPQYVCHKCLMGLTDMYRFAGNEQALEIVDHASDWFLRFSDDISRDTMTTMMDLEETGGIMELWGDLYALTGKEKYLTLLRRYERPALFEPLLRGEDVLTNMHSNATVPEIHGAARAYEVTGEERYRQIVDAYWRLAVEERGMYATGGQTCGEVWTPMGRQAARLGDYNQEHCVVYNMIRLADYLLRWTGEARFADYIERNLWNGILAQGFWEEEYNDGLHCDRTEARDSGVVSYFLGLKAGSQKYWGSKTDHFWCCHGTAVQANAMFATGVFFRKGDDIALCQFIPSKTTLLLGGVKITLQLAWDSRTGHNLRIQPVQREVQTRPNSLKLLMNVSCETPAAFGLFIRKPWWVTGEATILVNGEHATYTEENGYYQLNRLWKQDQISVEMPRAIQCHHIPDDPDYVAFLDGPVVLAGLCGCERTLYGDARRPEALLTPDCERQWQDWLPNWKTRGQRENIPFVPLYKIGRQPYTVYFPVQKHEI